MRPSSISASSHRCSPRPANRWWYFKSLVLVLTLAPGTGLRAGTEHASAWSFLPGPESRLHVEAPTGAINLRYAAVPSIVVRVVEIFPNEDESAWPTLREAYEIGILQNGDEVICIYRPRQQAVTPEGLILTRFEISLPERVPATLHVTLGDVQIEGVARSRLEVVATGGVVRVDTVAGELEVLSESGATSVACIAPEAREVRVRSQGGDVSLGLHPSGGYALTLISNYPAGEQPGSMMPVRESRGETGLKRVFTPATGGVIQVEGLKLKVKKRTGTLLKAAWGNAKTRVSVTSNGGQINLKATEEFHDE